MFKNVPKHGDNRCKDIAPIRTEMQGLVAQYVLLLALALAAPASLAQRVAPDALLRAVTWPTSQ